MVETGVTGAAAREAGGAGGGAGGKRGRRSDGGQAKEAIEQAARQLFAEHGFDRTSVRQVALAAGVDPMLVTHYFKTKAGLFAAVVQPPVDPRVAIDFVLEEGPEHAGERLARFVLRTLETPESQKWIVAMVRAASAEPEVAAVVRKRMAEPMIIPLAEAAGGDDPEYRAMLVITQLMGLVMARYIVKMEPLASRPVPDLVAALGGTFQRYLTGPLDE